MGIIAPVGEFISRCGRPRIGYYNRRDSYSSVNIKDPLELALLDTQLLLAFAVQSSRKLSKDKIVALTQYMPISARVYSVRICLGAIAGVFGGLLASAGDAAFKSLSLSSLFVPFVFGYGIEIQLALLDRVVRTFTQPETSASRPVTT